VSFIQYDSGFFDHQSRRIERAPNPFDAREFSYTAPLYNFAGAVFLEPVFTIVGDNGLFTDLGDSGSLITRVDGHGNRAAVAIVLGWMNDGSAPGGKAALALPVEPILTAFGVQLISGHNV
jgi:hypothetical protein